VKWQNL